RGSLAGPCLETGMFGSDSRGCLVVGLPSHDRWAKLCPGPAASPECADRKKFRAGKVWPIWATLTRYDPTLTSHPLFQSVDSAVQCAQHGPTDQFKREPKELSDVVTGRNGPAGRQQTPVASFRAAAQNEGPDEWHLLRLPERFSGHRPPDRSSGIKAGWPPSMRWNRNWQSSSMSNCGPA